MRVTINKDLISELYPLERKDLFKEYWHLEFYRRYKKGDVRRRGFLWLQKDIITENVYGCKVRRLKNLVKIMSSLKVIR